MVRIKCINSNCTSPTKSFDWDDRPHGGIAAPHAEGAKRVAARCSYCRTENYVWVKDARQSDQITRGGE